LDSCIANGIFILDRKPNPRKGNKLQKVLILNQENKKVQKVMNDQSKNKKHQPNID